MKHNLIAPLKFTPPVRRTFAAISIALSLVFALAALGAIGTSWSYQGQLRRSGAAYTGTCNFQFSLWNADNGGAQVGTTSSQLGVNVANGLFTVLVDFGASAFEGQAQWLQTAVQCSGDGGFTQLNPRQLVASTPYALNLRPGSRIMGDNNITALESTGQTGVKGICNWVTGNGVYGFAEVTDSIGVYGENLAGVGVKGSGRTGVYGVTGDAAGSGVWGMSTGAGSAIYGQATSTGLAGRFSGPVDIAGRLTVSTSSSNATAIAGTGFNGVAGFSGNSGGSGVRGEALLADSAGVFGLNRDSAGVWGKSTGAGTAVYGQATSSGLAGRFTGSVVVEGNLIVQGVVSKNGGNFRIDHPLDPANKFLSHSFVESPDMKNIYDGNVTTDATGSATVTLPDYFAALNRDCRYQLTVLGQFAQAIVSREIAGNSFEIQTDKPAVKVSWQVTGIRQDAWAKAKPIVVEEFKPAEEKGLYLYPAGFGAGEEKTIGYPSRPTTAPGAQNPPGAGPSTPASK